MQAAAARKFAEECRLHLAEHEKAGMPNPARYVRGLYALRNTAERHAEPARAGRLDLADYIEWLPDTREPTASGFRDAFRAAIREAVRLGPLFPVVEERIKALKTAADRLIRYASPKCYEDANPEYYEEADNGEWYRTGPSRSEADRDYTARHEEFADALDALAPFVGDPPATAAATSEKQTGGSRGRGGRPQNDEDLARDLLAGWKAFEPEEGRKTKDRYLAQRPDVRVLKSEDARQRKIASLRVALDSALHLRREKTKQRRQARG